MEHERLLRVIILGCYVFIFLNVCTFKIFEDRLLKRYEYECKQEINKLYS